MKALSESSEPDMFLASKCQKAVAVTKVGLALQETVTFNAAMLHFQKCTEIVVKKQYMYTDGVSGGVALALG